MLQENGSKILQSFAEQNFKPSVREIVPGIWHVVGIGHSNATIVEGNTGVILIDCFESIEKGQVLRSIVQEKTGKEVHTIIYSHGHIDHRGGAEAFSDSVLEIIAFAPKFPVLARTEMLQDVQMLRGTRQFGYKLSDEEALTQGLGNREGVVYGEHRGPLPVRPLYDEDLVERDIDGVKVILRRLPGETDDQMMVWLPEQKVLCCGDNYYGCFPNLYAIRGSQYRNIAEWIDSLDVILSYPAEYLLPGHTAPLLGRAQIQEVVGHFRDAIDWILTTTLQGMNAGKSMDELAAEIRLPEQYARLPYLGEHYGCTEWTVRAIYTAYLGWFDGNPTHLHPLPPKEHAKNMVALIGGREKVMEAGKEAYEVGAYQWCLELCDLLLAESAEDDVLRLKANAMDRLADYETSANGRHYYLACAKEILDALR